MARSDLNLALKLLLCLDIAMNPSFRINFSISDSLKTVRKSISIYETIIVCIKTFCKNKELKVLIFWKEQIRKYRQAYWDIMLNTLAMGISLIVLEVFIYPLLAKELDSELYGHCLLYTSRCV